LFQYQSTEGSEQHMKQPKSALTRLLPHGAIKQIADKLGVSSSAAAAAIRKGKPSHPAVAEAVRMVQESGVLAIRDAVAVLTG
jgi:hypothetical protein